MRITIVTQAQLGRPGGMATHIRLLQQGLQYNGHEADVISSDGLSPLLLRLVISLPLRMANLPRHGLGIQYAVAAYSRLLQRRVRARAARRGVPDAFACQDVASVKALDALRDDLAPQAAVLLTTHSQYTFEKVGQGWMRPHSVGERRVLDMERGAMLAADSLVAVSERMQDHIIELIGPTVRPITVLHNAIDVERFAPTVSDGQKERCRGRFGLEGDEPLVLIAGQLREIKGVHVAVEAARILKARGHRFRMVLAGEGPMRARLEAMIYQFRLRGAVRLLGAAPHDRMPTLYRASDILLMPSIPTYRAEESFGLSAVEGMACGLPVIASRSGGLEEIVRDGQTGMLVTPGDAEELADAIGALLEDQPYRVGLGEQGRDYAVSHHDHVAHGRRFAAVADAAASTNRGAAVVRMAG